MKTNYKSNTYSNSKKIFAKLIPIIPTVIFLLAVNVSNPVLIFGISLIIFNLIYVFWELRSLISVEFKEEHLVIKHLVNRSNEYVLYYYLVGLTVLNESKDKQSQNIIKYKVRQEIKEIKTGRIVNSNEFEEFFKWLKTKNGKIDIKVIPSDSSTNLDYKKVYSK